MNLIQRLRATATIRPFCPSAFSRISAETGPSRHRDLRRALSVRDKRLSERLPWTGGRRSRRSYPQWVAPYSQPVIVSRRLLSLEIGETGKPETTLRIYPIAQKSVAFAVRALSNQESTQSLTQCDPTAIKYRDHSHTTNDGLPFILLPLKPTYRKRDLGAANGDLGQQKPDSEHPRWRLEEIYEFGPNFAWNSDCRALSLQ